MNLVGYAGTHSINEDSSVWLDCAYGYLLLQNMEPLHARDLRTWLLSSYDEGKC